MSNQESQKFCEILKSLTDENGSGFYKFEEKGIEQLLTFLKKHFGERSSYELCYYSNSLIYKFTVDINENGVTVAKI